MNKVLSLFVLLALSFSSFAGSIKGTVKDGSNNSTLIGVTVIVKNTEKVTQTDIDGKYEILGLADGSYEVSYSYVTYTTQTKIIIVKNGADVVQDISLKPEGQELKTVNVKAARVTHTESAVMMEIRKSNAVVSGIGAAQIAKTQDRNAADVVKRVPGVTIQDDRFIVIRGLNDRYNTVWLNDAASPSSEVDKKSFSFDIIPSGLIDRILIFKTPSPDLPGDFAGGAAKVYTTSIPEKNQISFSLQTASLQGSTGTTFRYNDKSSTDWLGYDKGIRSLPANTPAYINKNDSTNNALTKSFPNDYKVFTKKQAPDMRMNFSLSNVHKFKNFKIGNTLGVTYSNTSTNYTIRRQDWQDTLQNYDYIDVTSTTKSNVSAMDNLGVTFGNSKIEFKNLYNQIGTASILYRNTNPTIYPYTADTNNVERSYSMRYESRAVYSTQLCGTHKTKDENTKYTWTLGYNDLFRNAPDWRNIEYGKQRTDNDSLFRAKIAAYVDPINGGSRVYAQLFEHTYSFNHQLSHKFSIGKSYNFEVSAGNYIEFKQRAYNMRTLGYTIQSGPYKQTLLFLPVNQIFADSNVGIDKKFKIDESTNAYDKYSAKNKLYATYLMFNTPVGNSIRVIWGARYEDNEQSIVGYNSQDTLKPVIHTKYLLPSINITYNLAEKSLVRLAYGKTLNRPEFREAAPVYFYDFEERAGNYGSQYGSTLGTDTLKVGEINNFDARWEWYPASGEMVHAGVYYKTFDNPIQRVVIPDKIQAENRAYTYINCPSAYVMGLEVDVRKNLKFLDQWIGTSFIKDFTFVGNVSFTKSELKVDSAKLKNAVAKNTPLQGQSPYVVNIGLFYQNDHYGLQGSLLYNVYAARTYQLGVVANQSLAELPFQSLDFFISKTFYKHYAVNFGVQNLLDESYRFVQDTDNNNKFEAGKDKEVRSYKPGRYISVGLKVKF
jgi:outer membrane receptor protein involved in Fe transport